MNRLLYLLPAFFLVFVGCNKDEEIIIDNDGNDPSAPESSLPYRVMEYTPAPGQYINDPTNGGVDIKEPSEAIEYAEKRLSNSRYVSLGSWGGYIVVKFDKRIDNSGDYDFAIGCNAFDTSNEPGIVWVMQDTNGNGLPDDTWYELKGSYFGQEGYERNYWVRYYRPDMKSATQWEDSNGEKGEVQWLGSYHSQDYYYPEWIKEDSYVLYGSRLPARAEQDDVTGNWINSPFDWGYADNFGRDFFKDNNSNKFKISNAVNENNEPVNLDYINFVKVQTAINNSSGWLGENSTEVTGFYCL